VKINNVAVIGAGTMGHGIAQVFALAGLQVALTDSDAKVLGKAIQRIQANLETCLEYSSVKSTARPTPSSPAPRLAFASVIWQSHWATRSGSW
jgi:3-hydroxyacyl-CoA dehydrogenase